MSDKPAPSFAPCYAALYPMLVAVARNRGYALCVHGSLARDFDLVAVPWTEQADPPETLINDLVLATGASITPLQGFASPAPKPHGRLGWALYLGNAYLDVSVMPRKEAP